ncbi:MBL fold metallo-hydrolase [Archangium violaceum]|uniref:MBL fold metallo-hydrolase n=1 Tax=Archangium violaceum TaxID=83451 RepID=UPI002B2F3DE2|nr:MBL fold metallo-hydrolase [Archangium violaceum]
MLGFETIGNATLIAIDGKPILATDPWISDAAYFGSWGLSYSIPPEQLNHIQECEYVWFSHGHPDHLNGDSLPALSGKKILIGDHVGGRIHKELTAQGFNVTILAERTWTRISDNIEVMCLTDYFQDSILLVKLGKRLVINLNDAVDRGWGAEVARVASQYEGNFLLKLSGYGDADMINLFDEDGERIEPWAAKKYPVGRTLIAPMRRYNARYFIPFSSFHCYRRQDSLWGEAYTTPINAYAEGFELPGSEVLPAFVRVDCETGEVTELRPPPADRSPRDPKAFGDDWSEPIDKEDRKKLVAYFKNKEVLASKLDFVRLRVGGSELTIDLNNKRSKYGVTFEVPRGSLMTAVEYEIFDDLLIGNFMKTTLHGLDSLYPWFTPIVAKYADNGRAYSKAEVLEYFTEYLRRQPKSFLLHQLENQATGLFRAMVPKDAKFYGAAKRFYYVLKGSPPPLDV